MIHGHEFRIALMPGPEALAQLRCNSLWPFRVVPNRWRVGQSCRALSELNLLRLVPHSSDQISSPALSRWSFLAGLLILASSAARSK